MEISIEKEHKVFKPININLRIESRLEFDVLKSLCGHTISIPDTLGYTNPGKEPELRVINDFLDKLDTVLDLSGIDKTTPPFDIRHD